MASNNSKYWLEKRSHRKTGFPLATLAYYGPTDKFASKVVAGVILSEGGDPAFMEKWFSAGADVRGDAEINAHIVRFLEQHNVHRVAMVARILGCPHEEGIDYPEGEKCPQCPFWADKDRWTGATIG